MQKALKRRSEDRLDAYLAELKNHPLLSREEERELAVRYQQTGDLDAARKLVTANLRLVVKLAHEYKRAQHDLLDLVQEGNLGLVQALRKYDPERGVRFSSYGVFWVRAYMLRFILNNWHLVKIGTTPAQRKLFFNLRKEQAKLEQGGFKASPAQLAAALQLPEAEIIDMQQRLSQGEASLDAPANPGSSDGDERTRLEMLPDDSDGPDEVAAAGEVREQLSRTIAAFGAGLDGRERTIFEERLMSDEPRTLQEIGKMYSISRERARQVEKQLVKKLKSYLRKELGEMVEIALDRAA
jgi:RNA polymerase sigma-32 factor